MFIKTRLKIMIFITMTVTLILVATIGAIYLSSYIEEYNQTVGQSENGILSLFEYGNFEDNGPPPLPEDLSGTDMPGQGNALAGREAAATMEMSVIKRFVGVIIKNTFRIGGIIIVIVFISSYFIAGWIIKPVEESYKKQKQFISDAGHELKTPIAAIDTNAELLYSDIGENKWLESIRYESGRMNVLIRQMLDLARTENIEHKKEEMDLSRLITGSVLPYEGVAFEKGFIIDTKIEDDISFKGDKSQMEQLSAILIDNAISHAKGKGNIEVELKKEGGNIIFKVSNPGNPISDKDAKNLFERFYRADQSHTDTGHYGLGLSIAKAIVTRHKGNISVKSEEGINIFTVKF
ncbi:MAG: HAMP domain-containing histidine kinase [Butyrivibrio sp.]|nr:HAMP domain-containing histidine kinase [Butyrivibrio sp.]